MLKNLYKKITRSSNKYPGYSGAYNTWAEAIDNSDGYDSEIILNKVKSAIIKVLKGQAAYERDSVVFDTIQYNWPLMSILLNIVINSENKLNIIDFGGSLGSSYFQNKRFLKELKSLRWNIIEQKKYVDCGKKIIKNNDVHFYESIDECLKGSRPNTILLSGILQYLEDPNSEMEKIINYGFKYIIIDRTGFNKENKNKLTIQKVPKAITGASYPCWLLDEKRFVKALDYNYNKIIDFIGFEGEWDDVVFKGMFYEKKK